jgi:hypothetical protein
LTPSQGGGNFITVSKTLPEDAFINLPLLPGLRLQQFAE